MAQRIVNMKGSMVGKGGPSAYGVATDDLGGSTSSRYSKAQDQWVTLIESCRNDPNEWYNRKFYYDVKDHKNSHATFATLFNQGGDTNRTTPVALVAYIKEFVAKNGGKFQSNFTRIAGPSDNPNQGNWMHMVFVRWVPGVTQRKES